MATKKHVLEALRKVSAHNPVSVEWMDNALNMTYDEHRKDSKHRFFFDNFSPKDGDDVLDVGCFIGIHCNILAQRYPKVQFKGVDIDPVYINCAKVAAKRPNNSFEAGDILDKKMARKNSADHIFFWEVLEHVDHPMSYLKRFHEILRPGGKLYLSTPNAIGITNILFNIKHQSLGFIEKQNFQSGTETDHIYVWDKLTLYRLLYKAGFKNPNYYLSRKFRIKAGQSACFIVEKAQGRTSAL